jgi:hypothetical protein
MFREEGPHVPLSDETTSNDHNSSKLRKKMSGMSGHASSYETGLRGSNSNNSGTLAMTYTDAFAYVSNCFSQLALLSYLIHIVKLQPIPILFLYGAVFLLEALHLLSLASGTSSALPHEVSLLQLLFTSLYLNLFRSSHCYCILVLSHVQKPGLCFLLQFFYWYFLDI